MAERKIGKYLLYAIGEIVLVVIGILIAVAINNNNQIKKTKTEEQQYLKALKEEFQFNKERLATMILRDSMNIEAAKTLLEYTSPKPPIISETEFHGMINKVVLNETQFSPSPGVLAEITNAGKLGSFSDPELKKALGAWEAQLVRVKFQEQEEVHRARMALINFLNTNSNARRGFYANLGKNLGIGDSKFKGQNQSILQLQQFENFLVDFLIVSYFLNRTYYKPLAEQIEQLIQIINDNITVNNNDAILMEN
ncbi:DUF6090 family protein [Roseivirga sp.]|uniref:DUF6090 family protein n=1 Tax=Roseivirga sp. TaxID=1964215 RepID=UPI003B8DF844